MNKQHIRSLFHKEISNIQIDITNQQLIVYISSKSELIECLRLANAHGIKISIVSQGKNWGYQSNTSDRVLINLSRMNRIIEYNNKLSYIVIEPGVTFQQLYNYLRSIKSELIFYTTGGPSEASIVATTMQRGIGKGTRGDLFNHVGNLEVVLPSGELLSTGFGRLVNSATIKNIHRNGNGPILDGLFSQSNFGIITRMTLFLRKKPKHYAICRFSLNDKKHFKLLVDTITKLKLDRIQEGNFLLGNYFRWLTNAYQYPWEKMNDKTPINKKVLTALVREAGLTGKWTGEFLIESVSKKILIIKISLLEKYLSSITNTMEFLTQEKIDTLSSLLNHISESAIDTKRKIESIISYYYNSVLTGAPHENSLTSMYWRKKIPVPNNIDPKRDKCGIIWFNAVLPIEGKLLNKINVEIEKIMLKHSLEPNIGFNFLNEQVCYLIGVILFDLEDMVQEQNAIRCNSEIKNYLGKTGSYPYRGYLDHKYENQKEKTYGKLLAEIQRYVDPNNVMS